MTIAHLPGHEGDLRFVGRRVDELPTPALVVDIDAVRRNVDSMASRMRDGPSLRPHAKTHKSVELARLQIDAGATGVTTATVWEAAAMARGGITDVLIANEVVGAFKIGLAVDIASETSLTVAVDDLVNARELSEAAACAGVEIGALVEVDVGMRRAGVRSAEEAALLALDVAELPALRFRGFMGYEGHCVLNPDPRERVEGARAAMERLVAAVTAAESAGVPVEVVSAGGTGTYATTRLVPEVTELQVGSYVFLDAAYRLIVPEFEVALTVLATVVSRHETTIVLDAGTKTISADFADPRLSEMDATFRYIAEEHLVFDVPPDQGLAVGDRARIVTGHCCGTTNLHRVHYVVENEVVVDVWPIVGRGPGGDAR